MTIFDQWTAQDWIGVVGAVVAVLGVGFQFVSFLVNRRPSVDSSYKFVGHPEMDDAVTVANLSPIPLQVSYWKLEWTPTFGRWWIGKEDQTPERDPEYESGFTILGHDTHTLIFGGHDKIRWGHRIAHKRQLILTMNVYGRRRPLRVRIK